MRKLALILVLFFVVSLGFAAQNGQPVSPQNYVIFRAEIPPMFIVNSSAPIQVLAIPFSDNKPVYASVAIHVQVQGINVQYNFSEESHVYSGRPQMIYLPAMKEGHYDLILYAEYHGSRSRIVDQDFAVSPAPEPYLLYFNQDGSYIHFKSLVLNRSGDIDPNVTFQISIYEWNGQSQSLVATYSNVTNLTIQVPDSWKGGILIVDVMDRFGWLNGMSIDLANFQFQGVPVQYDYHYAEREPFKSRQMWYLVFVIVMILVLAYIARRWYNEG